MALTIVLFCIIALLICVIIAIWRVLQNTINENAAIYPVIPVKWDYTKERGWIDADVTEEDDDGWEICR